jgi:hypothetical protein
MYPRKLGQYPPPWSVVELDESFVIEDANGQRLAFVYFETDAENDMRRSLMSRLTRDAAQRVAANIARLLELLRPINEPRTESREKLQPALS